MTTTINPSAIAALSALAAAGTQTGPTNAAPTKDKATVYMACGVLRDGVNAEEGINPETDLIFLPQMQGIDNMNPDTRRAGSQEFAANQAEKNDLLEDLKAQALSEMAPGEYRVVPFYVALYRKKDEIVAPPAAPRAPRKLL